MTPTEPLCSPSALAGEAQLPFLRSGGWERGEREPYFCSVVPPRAGESLGSGEGCDCRAEGQPVTPHPVPRPPPAPPQVEHIVSFLPVKDVVALGQTCHYFHEVCDAEGVWRRICRRLCPRVRDQGSGARPWKRAAILNCTLPSVTSSSPCLCPSLFWKLPSLSSFPVIFAPPGNLSVEETG